MKKLNPIAALVIGAALIAGLTSTVVNAQTNDTLAKVKASGVINMGVRDASGAMSRSLGDNKYAGFHTELCQRVIADIEKTVGRKVETKQVLVTSSNRIPLTQNGTVDIECGSTTNNATRQKDVSFAVTTYVAEVRIATKANAGITSINQLNGKNVATTTGTTSVQTLRKHERATGVDFKEIFGKDHADSFLLLETGKAEAFVMDDYILAGNIATAKNPADFKIVGETLAIEPIAIMFRKDDTAFKKLVDDHLKGLMKSGEIGRILAKYGLTAGQDTKNAWANPNDNPAESYVKK